MLMSEDYYREMSTLDEFQEDKNRGHGILIININDLLVAIPLRSKLKAHMQKAKHIIPYKTYHINGKEYLKGLDLSKMTFIEPKHVAYNKNYIFKDRNEKTFYLDNFNRIKLRINNYINNYIEVCKKIELSLDVSSPIRKYRFTTLKNFHSELGIQIKKSEFDQALNKTFRH